LSAVADSVGPMLEQAQQNLVLAGDVRLSQVMRRLRNTWSKARAEELQRAEAERVAIAKAAAIGGELVLVVELPIRTISEINAHQHWSKTYQQVGKQRRAIEMAVRAHANSRGIKVSPPCAVRIVRRAPDLLDTDNLRSATKHAQDAVADWLRINDRSSAVLWDSDQEKSATYWIRIEVRK
jgi:hypothetical protein